jgi:hypothetical protein
MQKKRIKRKNENQKLKGKICCIVRQSIDRRMSAIAHEIFDRVRSSHCTIGTTKLAQLMSPISMKLCLHVVPSEI